MTQDTDTPPERDPSTELSPTGRLVMRALREQDGRMKQANLSTETGMTQQACRKAVTRLENGGYVERRPHPMDARKRIVVLCTGT